MAFINLTDVTLLRYDLRSNRTGSNIKISLHDTNGTTSTHTANLSSADTFETQYWDISGISNNNKDTINQIIITMVNVDAANTFYIDNFVVAGVLLSDGITVSPDLNNSDYGLRELLSSITISDTRVDNVPNKNVSDSLSLNDPVANKGVGRSVEESLSLVDTIDLLTSNPNKYKTLYESVVLDENRNFSCTRLFSDALTINHVYSSYRQIPAFYDSIYIIDAVQQWLNSHKSNSIWVDVLSTNSTWTPEPTPNDVWT